MLNLQIAKTVVSVTCRDTDCTCKVPQGQGYCRRHGGESRFRKERTSQKPAASAAPARRVFSDGPRGAVAPGMGLSGLAKKDGEKRKAQLEAKETARLARIAAGDQAEIQKSLDFYLKLGRLMGHANAERWLATKTDVEAGAVLVALATIDIQREALAS